MAETIPFYSLTLGNLVFPRAALVVTCGACRRTAQVDVLPLLVRLGPAYGVRELERRLTCEACGRKGFSLVRVEWFEAWEGRSGESRARLQARASRAGHRDTR